jgi:hypothetical protein
MMQMRLLRALRHAVLLLPLGLLVPALSGCGAEKDSRPLVKDPVTGEWSRGREEDQEGIFGKGGIDIFGGEDKGAETGGSGIGVNAFLWRASLNTMAFMPLVSADPFGGVIITDWYQPEGAPGERFKVNVYILGTQLRSDGIKVSAFRQIRQDGEWVDAPTSSTMATDLENAILLAARELRMAKAN